MRERNGTFAFLLLMLMLGTMPTNLSVRADDGTIYIRADGSIEPSTAPIQRNGNTYTLTDNIYGEIVVEKANVTVDGNRHIIQGSGSGYGIRFNVNNVTIKRTQIAGFDYGINLNNSLRSAVVDNVLTQISFEGVHIYESSNITITRNRIVTDHWDGIVLYGSSNNTITGNRLESNYNGIRLFQSSNNTIKGNQIGNNYCGIFLAYSSNNDICSNNITANNGNGVSLYWSSNENTLTENDIALNNWYGILLNDSSHNTVVHNNFLKNAHQALSENSANTWDDGYPSGGNYWSEYNGTDADDDGIGDTAYTVDADDVDAFPLTMPTHAYISVPHHYQQKSYYCGPAALQMVFDFYGPLITQSEIADVARTASDGTYTPDMLRASHFSNLSTSVGKELKYTNITGYTACKLGYAAFEHGGTTINQLKSLVARGYLIIVLITWHFIVAVGYDSSKIVFQDSLNGPKYNMTYESFDLEWDYSGHWALLVSPWRVEVSVPQNVEQSTEFNVTASVTYPLAPPFYPGQYDATGANATITLPAGLTLAPSETPKKAIDTGVLAAGDSANVTWAVHAGSPGAHVVSVEAAGKVSGSVPPLPSYPEPYSYEDRIGGQGQSVINVTPGPDGIPPSTLDDYDGHWHRTDFTVTLTASDNGSGVAETYYVINEEPPKTVNPDGHPFIMTDGANNTLEYWSVDVAGNEELPHRVVTGIKLDKTAPTIGVPSREPADEVHPYQPVKVSVNITDATSQVTNATVHYTLTNGTTWETPLLMNYNVSTSLYEATSPGQEIDTWVEFKIVAYDNAGNNATLDGDELYCTYHVIPEFSLSMILASFMVAATLLIVISKKRKTVYARDYET